MAWDSVSEQTPHRSSSTHSLQCQVNRHSTRAGSDHDTSDRPQLSSAVAELTHSCMQWYPHWQPSRRYSRVRDVHAALNDLLTEVAAGSELLYDGLPASSLDGQPLAAMNAAHLAHPAIPAAQELLRGLCTTAGLCLEHVGCMLHKRVEVVREQAAVVQAATVRSRGFWCMMLGRLPEGCRLLLSPSCRWRRHAHCRHQGRHGSRGP